MGTTISTSNTITTCLCRREEIKDHLILYALSARTIDPKWTSCRLIGPFERCPLNIVQYHKQKPYDTQTTDHGVARKYYELYLNYVFLCYNLSVVFK